MKLRTSEILRECNGLTVVVRPNSAGVFVATVSIWDDTIIFSHIVKDGEVGKEIASQLRMIDKCSSRYPMASSSRSRNFK